MARPRRSRKNRAKITVTKRFEQQPSNTQKLKFKKQLAQKRSLDKVLVKKSVNYSRPYTRTWGIVK